MDRIIQEGVDSSRHGVPLAYAKSVGELREGFQRFVRAQFPERTQRYIEAGMVSTSATGKVRSELGLSGYEPILAQPFLQSQHITMGQAMIG